MVAWVLWEFSNLGPDHLLITNYKHIICHSMPGRNVANNQALLTSHMAQNSALNSMEIFVNILNQICAHL